MLSSRYVNDFLAAKVHYLLYVMTNVFLAQSAMGLGSIKCS